MSTRLEYDADFDSLSTTAIRGLDNPEEITQASKAVLDADQLSGMPIIRQPEDNHVTLARGIHRDGQWHRHAEVRELNGRDEEELARAGTNWSRFLSVLVQRGTVAVGGTEMSPAVAGELLIGDREMLILGIRRATFGDEIEVSGFICPHCDESTELTIHLSQIPVTELAAPDDEFVKPDEGCYLVELRGGRTARVRLPTGADQDHVLKNPQWTAAQQNTEMLQRCVRRISDEATYTEPVTGQDIRNLGMADRNKILKFLSDAQPGPRYNEVAFTHESCGREVPLPITLANLFLGN